MGKIEAGATGIAGRIFRGFAGNLLSEAIIKPLVSFMSIIFMWGFHSIMKLSGPEGTRLIRHIANTYNVSPKEWVPWTLPIFNSMFGTSMKAEEFEGLSSKGATTMVLKEFSSKIMNSLLGLIVPSGLIDEEKAMNAANNYLSINMDFQFKSWLLHLLGDVQSFGVFKSLKDIPNAVSWSFGLGWLSWLVMGTPFQVSIVEGMRWEFNRRLRPWRMSIQQLLKARRADKITAERFVKEMAAQGVRDEDMKVMQDDSEKDIADGMLRDAVLHGNVSHETAYTELTMKGYSKGRAEWIIGQWEWENLWDMYQKLYTEAVDLYVDNQLSRSELMTYAQNLWPSKVEVDIQLDLADMKKIHTKQVTDSMLINFYEEDIIGVATLRLELLNRGYDTKDVDRLIRYTDKKAKKPAAVPAPPVVEEKVVVKKISRSFYDTAFVEGRIDEEQYRDILPEYGIFGAEADFLVSELIVRHEEWVAKQK